MKVEHSVLIDRPVGDVFKYVTTYDTTSRVAN